MKINTTSPQEHKFLKSLLDIDDCPKKLYKIGNFPKEYTATIAIVGSRKPTVYGKEVAERLAFELAQAGVVVVSGLALGIDGIAHRAALQAKGQTVAVLANGLDSIYPKNHVNLANEIVGRDGALISEYPSGTPALPHQFLARNRIVSGLSSGVVVVEAAAMSGTLSTAAHALAQNREVFAVPGNITSPLSSGCNALIRQGAIPVTKTEDILDIIAPKKVLKQSQFVLGDNPEETAILELLQQGIRDGDEILQKANLPPQIFSQTLTMLEIKGTIKPLGGNQWTIR